MDIKIASKKIKVLLVLVVIVVIAGCGLLEYKTASPNQAMFPKDGLIDPTNVSPFTDILGHPAQHCIEDLVRWEVISASPGEKFRPNSIITREETNFLLQKGFSFNKVALEGLRRHFSGGFEDWKINFSDLPVSASRADVAVALCDTLSLRANRDDAVSRVEALSEEIQSQPQNGWIEGRDSRSPYQERGIAYSRLGLEAEAIKDFLKALELAPEEIRETWFASPLSPTENLIQAFQKPPNNAESYYKRAVIRYYLRDYEGAYRDLTKSIQLNANSANVYYMRGCSRSPFNPRWDKAVEDFTRAIELNPNLAEAYYKRGILRRHIGGPYYSRLIEKPDEKGAVEDFKRAMQLNPEGTEDYYSSEIYRNFKSPNSGFNGVNLNLTNTIVQKIIELQNQAFKLNPEYEFWDSFENSLRSCVDPQDKQKSLEAYNQKVTQASKEANNYYLRGLIQYSLGDRQEAVRDFTQVLKLAPQNFDAYYFRGLAYYRLKNYRNAISDFNKIVQSNSQDFEATFAFLLAQYDAGAKQKVLEDSTKILGETKRMGSGRKVSKYFFMRAQTQSQLGDVKAAQKDYQEFFSEYYAGGESELGYFTTCDLFYHDCPGGGMSVARVGNRQAKRKRF